MDKRAFSFGRVNEMRPCLFGIAIFLIMIFHSPLAINTYHVRFFKVFCNIGVEMFLVLSAIGLYRSRKNDRRLWPFYRKRIERTVLPLHAFGFAQGADAVGDRVYVHAKHSG